MILFHKVCIELGLNVYDVYVFKYIRMDIKQYFDEKKELQNNFLTYIDDSDSIEVNFDSLISFIKEHKIHESQDELTHLLGLLISIANNHHRQSDFFTKIKRVISYFAKEIKQNLTSKDIFTIFSSNKLLLLYLIKENIIKIDAFMIIDLYQRTEPNGTRYLPYFLPEIKEKLNEKPIKNIEFDFSDFESIVQDNYEEKRSIGENDSYICSLIRNDLIDDFISHVTVTNYPLDSNVEASVYETNSFLNESEVSLIEYAAFYGSIQIFQYLKYNNIELKPSLWIYALHSRSPDLIHLLEECQVVPDDKTYEKCFFEAIQCHHNDFADYVHNNLVVHDENASDGEQTFEERFIGCSFRHYNYEYFPENFDEDYAFFYLCKYKYQKIVDLFLESKKDEIELALITKNALFV
ncbi:hypothetical protein M9Y10_000544 [Tritrichomonas musculus]|uniref:DUF3447 domain-containing protein n=1 Tax=Tritrichomonas musculus TaxID=1915356 RepID=A0ABR2L5H4_9EUKA